MVDKVSNRKCGNIVIRTRPRPRDIEVTGAHIEALKYKGISRESPNRVSSNIVSARRSCVK